MKFKYSFYIENPTLKQRITLWIYNLLARLSYMLLDEKEFEKEFKELTKMLYSDLKG